MKKIKFLLLLLPMLLAAVLLYRSDQEPVVPVGVVASPANAVAEISANFTKQLQTRLTENIPAATPDATPAATLLVHARRFAMSQDHLGAYQVQRQDLAQLLRDAGQLPLAEQVLTDLTFAEQQFAQDQALVRVFAIKMLAEAARQGDVVPLQRTAAQLAASLEQQLQQGQPFRKAQQQDLLDLLHARVKLQPLQQDVAALTELVQALGYRPGLSQVLTDFYGDALFFALKKQYGRETAMTLTRQALQEADPQS